MVNFNVVKALFSATGAFGISLMLVYLNKEASKVLRHLFWAPFEDDEESKEESKSEEEPIDETFHEIF